MRYTSTGTAIANLSIATTAAWKDKQSGATQERTEWHRVVLYRRLAEIAGEYLRKGSKVFIEGRIQTRKWQDKSGADRYTTEIVADSLQMLDSKGAGTGTGTSTANLEKSDSSDASAPPSPEPDLSSEPDNLDDDIPF